MSSTMRLVLVVSLCAGCPSSPVEDTALWTGLTGTVLDAENDEPVDQAWVVVDDGEALPWTRTGADGSFSFAEVAEDAVVSLSFAAEGREALTWQEVAVADLEVPLVVHGLEALDDGVYDVGTLTVEGTIDAPVGYEISICGSPECQSLGEVEEEPMAFSFEAPLRAGETSYAFTTVARSQDGEDLRLARSVATGSALAITPKDQLDTVTLQAPWPTVDGQESESIQLGCPSATTWLEQTWAGMSTSCVRSESGAEVVVQTLPGAETLGMTVDATLSLTEDLWAVSAVSLPLDGEDMDVELPDSPVVDHADLTPDTPASWTLTQPSDEVEVVVTDHEHRWVIVPSEGSHQASLPRLPDEVDRELFAADEGAEWRLETSWEVGDTHGGSMIAGGYLVW